MSKKATHQATACDALGSTGPGPTQRRPRSLLAALAVAALTIGLSVTGAGSASADPSAPPSIADIAVPTPTSWTDSAGTTTLTTSSRIVIDPATKDTSTVAFADDPVVMKNTTTDTARVFSRDLKDVTGLDLPVGTGVPHAGDVSFSLDEDPQVKAEGYTLTIADGQVSISANTNTGLFYGGRTVLQALKVATDRASLHNGSGTDVPGTQMRSYQADVARSYWTMQSLEDTIRQMGWNKQNILFLHFDDAEGFRLDSPKYPGLAPKGFSYSKKDIQDLVDLGHANNVWVVPGFEFPSHTSAKAAYFKIGMDTPAPNGGTCGQAYSYSHLKPEFTMNFMNPRALAVSQELVSEFSSWFDAPWVRLGGDEMPPAVANCPDLKTYLADSPDLTTAGDVQAQFINALDAEVHRAGKTSIIFNGFESETSPQVQVNKDIIVQAWLGDGDSAALAGYKKIVGNSNHYYLVPTDDSNYPKLETIYTGTSAVDPSDPNVLGLGMLEWGDNLGWAQGQYLEQVAYLPRAISAMRMWNTAVPKDTLNDAIARINAVGPAPFYFGAHGPSATTGAKPIHNWLGAVTEFPAGTYDAHTEGNRRGLADECGFSGMSRLSNPVSQVTDADWGTVQRYPSGVKYNFGAPGVYGPWTLSLRVNMPAFAKGTVMLAPKTAAKGLERDGKVVTDPVTVYFSLPNSAVGAGEVGFTDQGETFSFGYSMPVDTWVQLSFVQNGSSTTLYANGAQVGFAARAFPLQLAELNMPPRSELQSMQQYAQALTAKQVASRATTTQSATCQAPATGVTPPKAKDAVSFASVVTGISPATAKAEGGTVVTLEGSGFTDATGVVFTDPAEQTRGLGDVARVTAQSSGGVSTVAEATADEVVAGADAATAITVVDDSTITFTAPPHTAGMVGVIVIDPDGNSAPVSLTYLGVTPTPDQSPTAPGGATTSPAPTGSGSGSLPKTGAPVVALVILAIGVVAVGGIGVFGARRREAQRR